MKARWFLVTVALVVLSIAADGQTSAQPTFDSLKALSGSWEGTITTVPENTPVQGKHVQVTMRVASSGTAILHDVTWTGRADNEISVLYVDGSRVLLTHYCDADNRPQMAAKTSADGKRVDFDLIEVGGSPGYGHVQHVVFTFGDARHHTEEWTFIGSGGDIVHAQLTLQRTK